MFINLRKPSPFAKSNNRISFEVILNISFLFILVKHESLANLSPGPEARLTSSITTSTLFFFFFSVKQMFHLRQTHH
jgi:hypothetical protein